MAERTATADWTGSLMEGNGKMALGSGLFEGPFSFNTRMGDEPGTNPEELLGGSLAGCFAMALNATLEKSGKPAKHVHTKANVHLGKDDGGFAITRIDLLVQAEIDGVNDDEFRGIVDSVECPISKALAATKIVRTTELIGAKAA